MREIKQVKSNLPCCCHCHRPSLSVCLQSLPYCLKMSKYLKTSCLCVEAKHYQREKILNIAKLFLLIKQDHNNLEFRVMDSERFLNIVQQVEKKIQRFTIHRAFRLCFIQPPNRIPKEMHSIIIFLSITVVITSFRWELTVRMPCPFFSRRISSTMPCNAMLIMMACSLSTVTHLKSSLANRYSNANCSVSSLSCFSGSSFGCQQNV